MLTDNPNSQEENRYMEQLIRQIVQNLDDITGLEMVWKHGVVHSGGPHYRLKGTLGPMSLGEDECLIIGRAIREIRPKTCFIIGNAFGMSSVFIAKMMEHYDGKSVITLDSKSEGDGERCFEAAGKLNEKMNCRLLRNKVGWSPQDINNVVEENSYDLIFIDGDHSHPQVTRDLEGVQHLARPDTVVLWHDYWLAGVPESVSAAQQMGYHCVKVNSSCEMVFGTKDEGLFNRIQSLYPQKIENPQKQWRAGAYLKLYSILLTGALKNNRLWSRS